MGQLASKMQLRMAFLRWALVLVPLVLLLGFLSGKLSGSASGDPWFAALTKPALMPPGWAFGAAWSILYILMGFAVAIIASARGARQRRIAIAFFVVQLVLNLAWSPLFFGAHQVTAALALLLILIIVAGLTTLRFWRIRPLAGALMVPYLLWLLFAAVLNYQTMRLNPEAETLAPGASHTQITL